MKTAIYIEDGVVQLVLTPESKFEKQAIMAFADKPVGVQIFDGSFYDCRGGWVRQSAYHRPDPAWPNDRDDRSLIIKVDEKSKSEEDNDANG